MYVLRLSWFIYFFLVFQYHKINLWAEKYCLSAVAFVNLKINMKNCLAWWQLMLSYNVVLWFKVSIGLGLGLWFVKFWMLPVWGTMINELKFGPCPPLSMIHAWLLSIVILYIWLWLYQIILDLEYFLNSLFDLLFSNTIYTSKVEFISIFSPYLPITSVVAWS